MNEISASTSTRHLPVSEARLPKVRRVRLRDAELVPGEQPVWEDGLQLAQHVRKHQTQLGEVPPVVRVLVKHLLLALLEQLDGLFALPHQVVDEDVKVLVAVQEVHLVLVLGVDQVQPLVRVGQDVQYEGRGVFEVHLGLLAKLDDLVHQFPRLLQGLFVR